MHSCAISVCIVQYLIQGKVVIVECACLCTSVVVCLTLSVCSDARF